MKSKGKGIAVAPFKCPGCHESAAPVAYSQLAALLEKAEAALAAHQDGSGTSSSRDSEITEMIGDKDNDDLERAPERKESEAVRAAALELKALLGVVHRKNLMMTTVQQDENSPVLKSSKPFSKKCSPERV